MWADANIDGCNSRRGKGTKNGLMNQALIRSRHDMPSSLLTFWNKLPFLTTSIFLQLKKNFWPI
jgi:hypothetical protein